MYALARSALFGLDAERAHALTLKAFARFPRLATAPFAAAPVRDPVRLLGLDFPNRVGLAAGLDKNGECIEAWARLGFGFIEVGTVTPRPQPGNPKPRMFRLPKHSALINRLGFNNQGVDYLLAQVARSNYRGVLGINIGKNASTSLEHAADDYLECVRKVHRAASYVTVNISSPNTQNLRALQDQQPLTDLLRQLAAEREVLAQRDGKRTPLLIKLAPDLDDAQLAQIARTAQQWQVDGLIASNTTLARPYMENEPLAVEPGGLSGAPLRALANTIMQRLRAEVGSDYPLIGVGGIGSGADALERRAAGADLVQVYTGFIYRGPPLIPECAKALAEANGTQ